MRSPAIFVTGLVSAAAAIVGPESCSVDDSLQYFNCIVPGPGSCHDSLEEQAKDWCRSYLSIAPVASYLSTSTPIVQETATETSTSLTATIEITTTTTETTATLSSTEVITESTTTTVTAAVSVMKRTTSAAPSCPTLNARKLTRRPASGLSSACSCLNSGPSTVTLPVTTAAETTATVTELTVTTDISSQTSVSTEVSVTEATDVTTVTSTVVATSTVAPVPAVPANYQVKYNASGKGIGNSVTTVTSPNALACCQTCQATANCVAVAFIAPSICQLLVKRTALTGAPVNAQCPLGVEGYNFGSPNANGVVYKGSCGA